MRSVAGYALHGSLIVGIGAAVVGIIPSISQRSGGRATGEAVERSRTHSARTFACPSQPSAQMLRGTAVPERARSRS